MLLSILYNIIISIIFLSGFLFLYYNYAFSYWKTRGVPHLTPKFPLGNLKGNIFKFTGQIIAGLYHELKQRGYQYGGAYFLTTPVFIPISPEINKAILLKHFHQFCDHGIDIDFKRDKMGSNILTQTGTEWRQMRMKITPAFAPAKLKLMYPLVTSCHKDFDQILSELSKNKENLDVLELSSRFFTDVIGSCAFGINCNCVQNPNSEFRQYGKMVLDQNLFNLIRMRLMLTLPWICRLLKINFFAPKATSFFRSIVLKTMIYRNENNIQRHDLLDNFIRLKKKQNNECDDEGLDDDQIASQTFLYYLAGTETSSTTAAYCMTELAYNADIQNKVRHELMNVLHEHNGELTFEAIMKLQYLDNVISETLRKYPTPVMLDRMCTESCEVFGTDIKIEKGTRVIISTLGIHNDPEFYPDPEKFDPERFNEAKVAERIPFTYLPFGDGPRICPGAKFGILTVKAFVAAMLKNHRFVLHPSVKMPLEICSVANMSSPITKLLLNVEKL